MSEQLANTTESTAVPAVPVAEVQETVKVTEAPVQKTSAELLAAARAEVAKAKESSANKKNASALQEELSKYQKELEGFRSIKESYKANPEEALARLGLTYEELTNAIIEWEANKPIPEERDELSEQIDAKLKEREEAQRQAQLEALEEEKSAAVAGFYEEIGEFLKTNEEKYPLLREFHETLGGVEQAEDIIFSAIEQHYDATGELLEFSQVADVAEAWFSEEVERIANKNKKVTTPAAPVEEKREVLGSVDERQSAQALSFQSFEVKERDTPTSITNKLAQPKRVKEFDPKDAVRRDAISRAIDLLEQYDRKK